jgi:hypothetical protein
MSRVGKVKPTICETSMSARFKVKICKSKVEISASHNRPTKKMWMESLLISKSEKVEWRRCCWLKEVGSCQRVGMDQWRDETDSLARMGNYFLFRFAINADLGCFMWMGEGEYRNKICCGPLADGFEGAANSSYIHQFFWCCFRTIRVLPPTITACIFLYFSAGTSSLDPRL